MLYCGKCTVFWLVCCTLACVLYSGRCTVLWLVCCIPVVYWLQPNSPLPPPPQFPGVQWRPSNWLRPLPGQDLSAIVWSTAWPNIAQFNISQLWIWVMVPSYKYGAVSLELTHCSCTRSSVQYMTVCVCVCVCTQCHVFGATVAVEFSEVLQPAYTGLALSKPDKWLEGALVSRQASCLFTVTICW